MVLCVHSRQKIYEEMWQAGCYLLVVTVSAHEWCFFLWLREWEINPGQKKIRDPAGIRTQDLLNTSQMLYHYTTHTMYLPTTPRISIYKQVVMDLYAQNLVGASYFYIPWMCLVAYSFFVAVKNTPRHTWIFIDTRKQAWTIVFTNTVRKHYFNWLLEGGILLDRKPHCGWHCFHLSIFWECKWAMESDPKLKVHCLNNCILRNANMNIMDLEL